MATEIITKEDPNEFRELLLKDLKALLPSDNAKENVKWLKSYPGQKYVEDLSRYLAKLKSQWYTALHEDRGNHLL